MPAEKAVRIMIQLSFKTLSLVQLKFYTVRFDEGKLSLCGLHADTFSCTNLKV